MGRLRDAVLAVALATGGVGCATFCDECDDFPSPGGPGGFSLMPGSYAGPPLSAAPDPGPAGVSSPSARPAPSGSGPVPRGEQASPPPAPPAVSRDAVSVPGAGGDSSITAPTESSARAENDSPIAVPAESSTRAENDSPIAVPAESSARSENDSPIAVPAESSSSSAPVLASPSHDPAAPTTGGSDR